MKATDATGPVITVADSSSTASKAIARRLHDRFVASGLTPTTTPPPSEQTAGALFEQHTIWFLDQAIRLIVPTIRPAGWHVEAGKPIIHFSQYRHLATLEALKQQHDELQVVLGEDYLVKPDIVVWRDTLADGGINQPRNVIGDDVVARRTLLRTVNQQVAADAALLHASISCKLTIRSDRVQNTRTEAVNLYRNRNGPLPRMAAITGEPLPSRIKSIALGGGDLDAIYHMALPELIGSVDDALAASTGAGKTALEGQKQTLALMVESRRLKDVADLPLDLAA